MPLYAIGDLHLSLSANKPMEIFGGRWINHIEKLKAGFSGLGDDDLCVICGDLSWAMDMPSAIADFKFLSALPGKKIVLKGNHDYWWTTATKARRALESAGITNIEFLHNNCHFYDGRAICGTRGWFYEVDSGSEHDKKIMLRELMRLEASLKAAGEAEKYVFLHYPPRHGNYTCGEIIELLKAYKVKMCCAGHIHGKGLSQAVQGIVDGLEYRLVSADNIDFEPVKII